MKVGKKIVKIFEIVVTTLSIFVVVSLIALISASKDSFIWNLLITNKVIFIAAGALFLLAVVATFYDYDYTVTPNLFLSNNTKTIPKKVDFTCVSSKKGHFIWEGSNLWDALYYMSEEYSDEEDEIQKYFWPIRNTSKSPDEYSRYVGRIFYSLKLDFTFAKDLNLLDVIHPDCFSYSNEHTKAMVDTLALMSFAFVVTSKDWITPNHISLKLEPIKQTMFEEFRNAFVKGKIKDNEDEDDDYTLDCEGIKESLYRPITNRNAKPYPVPDANESLSAPEDDISEIPYKSTK